MTRKQQMVLDFIIGRIDATGLGPTLDEINAGVGLRSKGSTKAIVDRLVEQGHLVRQATRHRGIALPRVYLSSVATADLRAELERRERRHAA